jgi:hypothetical protein
MAHNVPRVGDGPRAQQGRGAMWRSGASQRRAARGTRFGCRCAYALLSAVALKFGSTLPRQIVADFGAGRY